MQARWCKYAIRENMEKTAIAYIQREAMDASSVRRNPIIGSALLDLSPVAEIIANNVDLLTLILLCFPAKSLIRFKSVLKHWLSPRYKVVFLGGCYSKVEKLYIYVYCSERSSWNLTLRNPLATMLAHEVFCGGVMYWLSDEGVVLGFDIDLEKMIKKTYPPKSPCVHNVMFFGECDDHLILIQTRTISAVIFRILEMDKAYNRWIVKFWVDLELLLLMESELCSHYVLCVVMGDKEKVSELVLDLGGKVISYNLRCQTWNVLIGMAPGKSISCSHPSPTAYPYIESLSPL